MKPSHLSAPFVHGPLAVAVMLCFAASAQAGPLGGAVAAGTASIATSGTTTTITQSTPSLVVNWQSFGIAAGETVRFAQPGTSSVALNRVLGSNPSAIFGNLSSNGKVFLVNPSGILFGSGSSVNVGGLVASTLQISDADFLAGRNSFSNAGSGAIVNQGTINAPGGYVALLGNSVTNQGVISARMGMVALAAGNAVTLDIAGDRLLNVSVDQGAVDALVANGGMIRADGGQVLLTTQAAGSLMASAVNNTGVIQAQTISNSGGTIKLMGGMQAGTVNVAGTLDASAPVGGNGGFIETSAAHVKVNDGARITTAASRGTTGTWLIDPVDFVIQAGFDISGAALALQLRDSNVVITTVAGPGSGNGDIFVNEAIDWNGALGTSLTPTTLTLNALRDVNIGRNSAGAVIPTAAITATNGNLSVCCGRDVNVFAAITSTDGSVLLSAGSNVSLNAAMTTTRGNLTMCAGRDVLLNGLPAALVLTDIAAAPERSLGLTNGLMLSAGTNGTGPGVAGGTVIFAPFTPPAAITRAPVEIHYNPVSYAAPTDYSTGVFFTLVGPGATVTQKMLVFAAGGDKTFDGTTATTLTSLKGGLTDVTLVASGTSVANFDSAIAGTDKSITLTGYTLGGTNAGAYALATTCCGVIASKTTGSILAAVAPPPPAPTPAPPAPTPAPPAPTPPAPTPPAPTPPAPTPPAPTPPAPTPPAPPPPVPAPPPPAPPPVAEVIVPPDVVLPQFQPFIVTPVLFRQGPVLTITPAPLPAMALVKQEEAPAPVPELVVPPPAPAPLPRFVPKQSRN